MRAAPAAAMGGLTGMVRRRHKLRPGAAALLCAAATAFAAVAQAAGGAGGIDQSFRVEAAAAARHVAAVRAAWAKVVARFASSCRSAGGGEAVLDVRVALPKAVMGRDVLLAGVRVGGRWLDFAAWVPARNTALEVVSPAALSARAAPDGGAVTGDLAVRIPQRLSLDSREDMPETFSMSLKPTPKGLAGTYVTKSGPLRRGVRASATVAELGATFAPPADLPTIEPAEADAFDLYAACVEAEREACRKYAQALWCDSLLRGNAAEAAPDYPHPIRPPFAPKPAPKGKTPAGPSPGELKGLGDLSGDLGLGLDAGPMAPRAALPAATERRSAEGHADAADRLAVLRELNGHLERIERAMAQYLAGPPPAPAGTFADTGDRLFGPWYTFRALPGENGRPNVLPPYAGGAGEQEWLYVDRWQVLGPLELGLEAVASPPLPAAFHLPRASWPADPKFLPRLTEEEKEAGGAAAEEPVIRWQPWPVEESTGILRPPGWWINIASGYGHCRAGMGDTSWLAATEVYSDADRQVWLAAGADDDCQLWLNDRLVACWPVLRERRDLESPILFRASFRAGRNTLLARVRQTRQPRSCPNFTGLWLRVCTRGAPLPPADAGARDKALAARGALRPFGPNVRGWRGNWTGVEADARPVTAWDVARNINVRWRTPLPRTISTPVVTGDVLLTTGDPYYLIALDKTTGKVLWRKPLDVLELLAPDVAKKSLPIWEEYYELFAAAHPLVAEPGTPYAEEPPVKFRGQTMTYADARMRLRELERQWGVLAREAVEKSGHPWKYLWMRYMGQICATPVTDGKRVWAWTSMGAAACFDLDGTRRWLVELPHRSSAYSAFATPLLIDGLLILQVVPEDKRIGNLDIRPVWLLALDAETGKERWRAPIHAPAGCSSAVAMRISSGRDEMNVIISPGSGTSLRMADGVRYRHVILGGTVVRADDGKVLVGNMSVTTGYGTPVVDGDVVYHFGPGMGSATRLVMLDRDHLVARRLWTVRTDKGFEPDVSGLGGLLYANLSIVNVGGQGDGGYGVWSAADGRRVARHVNVDWPLYTTRSTGRSYVPTSVAGGYVFCGDSGEAFGGKHMPQANMTVIEAAPQGRIVAQNGLPPRTNSGLTFDGDRIYYRNTFGIICLGYTGEEGKAYEAEVNARLIMEDLPPERPRTVEAVEIPPEGRLHPLLPRQSLWGRPGPPYLMVGPFSADVRAAMLAALTGNRRAALRVPRGELKGATFDAAGATHTFRHEPDHPHSWSHLTRRGRVVVYCPNTELFNRAGKLDKPTDSIYFYTLLSADETRVVRFIRNTANAGVRVWLGGVPLDHQGRYRVTKGDHTLLAEFRPGNDAQAEDLCLDVRFVPSADAPADDVKAWRETLRHVEPYLRRVVELKADSDTAKHAAQVLATMKD